MNDLFIDWMSVYRGVRVMRLRNKAWWSIKAMPKRVWLHAWTPIWHDGRGPYVSCGLWFFSFYRGY